MLKGFKEFILRGNVIDLAVAVVIGAAFTGIVNAIVDQVLNPLIGAMFNSASLSKALPVHVGKATLEFGAVLAALLQFLLVSAVIYFALVMPINYLRRVSYRKQEHSPTEPAPPTELELLADIRDLLADNPRPEGGREYVSYGPRRASGITATPSWRR